MSKEPNPDTDNLIDPGTLKQLSTVQLQQWLESCNAQEDSLSRRDQLQALQHQLQISQIELEVQNRELQATRQQLQEARDQHANFYDFAPISFITFDHSGHICEINLTGAAILGIERSRLLGQSFSQYLDETSQSLFAQHLKLAEKEKHVRQELVLKVADDQYLDVRLKTVCLDELINGKPSYRSVMNDITMQKLAESEIALQAKRLRILTDTIPAYIAYVDKDERYQFANNAYEAWFKESFDNLVGRSVREVLGKENYGKVNKYIQRALAGEVVKTETSAIDMNGKHMDVTINYIPDMASDGSVAGYFVVNQNITDIRDRERLDKLHMLKSARVARINTMGEMVSELAHELNQPLAAITIYSDAVNRMLSKDAKDTPEMSKALAEIRLQAERAGEVIRRLREFVSKRELMVETVELNELVQEVLHLITVEARWHESRVSLELMDEISLVGVDRILIEQVILNLARNAIEAMDVIEASQRILTIKTRQAYQDTVELVVEDTGPGIKLDELDKIFEPFYTSKAEGMGMGLAISRNIIKAHGGRLWAVPNEVGGTTFTFTLPLRLDSGE